MNSVNLHNKTLCVYENIRIAGQYPINFHCLCPELISQSIKTIMYEIKWSPTTMWYVKLCRWVTALLGVWLQIESIVVMVFNIMQFVWIFQ